MTFGQRVKRIDGILRAIDTGTTEEYHDLQDKRKQKGDK